MVTICKVISPTLSAPDKRKKTQTRLVNIWTVSGSSELKTLGSLAAVTKSLAGAARVEMGVCVCGVWGGRWVSRMIWGTQNKPHYYWRYTRLERADSTVISPRRRHTLTPLPLLRAVCPLPTTRRHSSHAQAAAGGCLSLRRLQRGGWERAQQQQQQRQQRQQSASASSQVGATDLTLVRNAFRSKKKKEMKKKKKHSLK